MGQTAMERVARSPLTWIALVALVGLVYPVVITDPFLQHVGILVCLYGTMSSAWNLLGGYAGQVSLGHALFFGIGAYTSTVLLRWYLLSPWVGMLVGAVLAVLVSLLIGYPTFRLTGHYFSIATIAVAEIAVIAVTEWEVVGGASGIRPPPLPEALINLQFQGKLPYCLIALGMLIMALLTTHVIERNRWGYYFRAIREDAVAAASLGVDVARYKLYAMAISALLTSVAGTFHAQYVLYVDPSSTLALSLSILIALTAILGGTGTLFGPLVGAIVLQALSALTRVHLSGAALALDLLVYGFLIMVIAVLQPRGLMGLAVGWRRARRPGTVRRAVA
jgi:branched-chain amino acid transport system permease protein